MEMVIWHITIHFVVEGQKLFTRDQGQNGTSRLYNMLELCPSGSEPSLTLTLTLQDSGPFSHRTMFRFSKLKLIGLGCANQIVIVAF